jgi:hypothetical protein
MNELSVQEAALAWAQGKKVEAMGPHQDAWGLITPIGGGKSLWTSEVFTRTDKVFTFRLATEPPSKRYRPWTPEEVPLNAWFKGENGIGFKLAYADLWKVDVSPTVANGSGSHLSLNYILKVWKHSTDNGKTWLPCGVEVEA